MAVDSGGAGSGASDGYGPTARPVGQVRLRFTDLDADGLSNCSAATRAGDALFVAADERADMVRLLRERDGWAQADRVALADLLPLAWPDEEADVEGLAEDDGWLWVVGSHARTRRKPEKEADAVIDLDRLADLKDTRARCLLARLPLRAGAGGPEPVARDGKRRAGMLRQGKHGNALLRQLRADPLLAPFVRVPAKEGGLDVEGVAVCGDRVALGLRGPVIATHAVLVEFRFRAGASGRLRIAEAPVKRLLALDGLGIRDLKRHGDDLLILAGPTTGLSGPCRLYRWRDWAGDPPRDAHRVRLHRPDLLLDLPFGRGVDHAEGLALFEPDADEAGRLLVIHDSPAAHRVDEKKGTLTADLFVLPA